jgi:ketosteroid isomerase-like protein
MIAAAELVRRAYEAFNARDLDAALALMAPDVDWPNAWEGGRVVGHDAVRAYWSRQWKEIDPRVDPVGVTELPDGRIAVDVHSVVRSASGELLADTRVEHVYTLGDGLIVRMDVSEPPT